MDTYLVQYTRYYSHITVVRVPDTWYVRTESSSRPSVFAARVGRAEGKIRTDARIERKFSRAHACLSHTGISYSHSSMSLVAKRFVGHGYSDTPDTPLRKIRRRFKIRTDSFVNILVRAWRDGETRRAWLKIVIVFSSMVYTTFKNYPAQPVGSFTLRDILGKPWSQVGVVASPPYLMLAFHFIAHLGVSIHSHCS